MVSGRIMQTATSDIDSMTRLATANERYFKMLQGVSENNIFKHAKMPMVQRANIEDARRTSKAAIPSLILLVDAQIDGNRSDLVRDKDDGKQCDLV